MTGWDHFDPTEAGYDELRRVFDWLQEIGQIGPRRAGTENGQVNGVHGDTQTTDGVEICVVDADDLLDDPKGIIEGFCKSVGLDFKEEMLNWDTEEEQKHAVEAFAKWKGFHEDALESKDLKPRAHKKKQRSEAEWYDQWKEQYGETGAKIIRDTVEKNMQDYLYLKQFCLKA